MISEFMNNSEYEMDLQNCEVFVLALQKGYMDVVDLLVDRGVEAGSELHTQAIDSRASYAFD